MTPKRKKDNTPRKHQIQRQNTPPTQTTVDLALQLEQFAGPIPPPELLREYESVSPGSADRIIKMAEEQGQHRRQLEKTHLQDASRRSNTGMWLGFIATVLAIIAGTIVILEGHGGYGFAIILANAAVLGGAFITGRISQARERTQKARLPIQVSQRR